MTIIAAFLLGNIFHILLVRLLAAWRRASRERAERLHREWTAQELQRRIWWLAGKERALKFQRNGWRPGGGDAA